jgi:hypothetical protein
MIYLDARGKNCPESLEVVVELLAALALRQDMLRLVVAAVFNGRLCRHIHPD